MSGQPALESIPPTFFTGSLLHAERIVRTTHAVQDILNSHTTINAYYDDFHIGRHAVLCSEEDYLRRLTRRNLRDNEATVIVCGSVLRASRDMCVYMATRLERDDGLLVYYGRSLGSTALSEAIPVVHDIKDIVEAVNRSEQHLTGGE